MAREQAAAGALAGAVGGLAPVLFERRLRARGSHLRLGVLAAVCVDAQAGGPGGRVAGLKRGLGVLIEEGTTEVVVAEQGRVGAHAVPHREGLNVVVQG